MSSKVLHHVCIQTQDYQESLKFYTTVLGFELVSETANFHGRDYNTWLKCGSFLIELQTAKHEETLNRCSLKDTGVVHLCFKVDNVNRELDELSKAGFKDFMVKNGATLYKVENGYLFKIRAPEGTVIEFRDTDI